jgi:phosphopantetheinyl transferase
MPHPGLPVCTQMLLFLQFLLTLFPQQNFMGEIIRERIDDHSVYAVWEITEEPGELIGMIRLRCDEQRLYNSFVAEERKKQWLAYRILIRSLLAPDDIPVEYDPVGKPFLAGTDHHISVTHSFDLAGIIISRKKPVGIDIEKVKPRIEKVKERFLSKDELARVAGDSLLELLTLAWCAKEALYKIHGNKSLDFRENIRVNLPANLEGHSFRGEIFHEGKIQSYDLHYRTIGGYILVYAMEPGY